MNGSKSGNFPLADTPNILYIIAMDVLISLLPVINDLLQAGKSAWNILVKPLLKGKGYDVTQELEQKMMNLEENKNIEAINEELKKINKELNQIVVTQSTSIDNKNNIEINIIHNEGRIIGEEKTSLTKHPEINISDTERILPGLFNQKGILCIHDGKQYNKMSLMIKKAKHSIKIISYYGENFLNTYRSEIINLINEKNIEVDLLLAMKNSVLLNEISKMEGDGTDRYGFALGILNKISEQTTKKPDKLVVKRYNTQARYALTIIDDEWAWWTPYHPGKITEDSPSFELVEAGDGSFIRYCKEHFDALWRIAKRDNSFVVSK
jgi:hypothetical protein